MIPATGPFRIRQVTTGAQRSVIEGSYVIEDSNHIIVVTCPHADKGPLSRAQGTAQLVCAGMNHLPAILERIARAERCLDQLRQSQDIFHKIDEALTVAQDALRSAMPLAEQTKNNGVIDDIKDGLRDIDKALNSGFLRLMDGASNVGSLLDAYDRARTECP